MSSNWPNTTMSSTEPTLMKRSDNLQSVISRLNTLAVNGLVPMFDSDKQLFCYTLKRTPSGMVREGHLPAVYGDYIDGASPARTKRRDIANRYPTSI